MLNANLRYSVMTEYSARVYSDRLCYAHRDIWTGNIVTIEIIIVAMVAAFLGLRLYSVLGKKTGHEQEPNQYPPSANSPKMGGQQHGETGDKEKIADRLGHILEHPQKTRPEEDNKHIDPAALPALRHIVQSDRNFQANTFLDGAKNAYGMILESFWNGDTEQLRALCDDDVYEGFAEAIAARTERGEVLENRLVRIEDCRIIHAHMEQKNASITLRFDADIAAIVRDADGEIIAGSLTDAVTTHDIWTFSRNLSSTDPNWLLTETDQA